MTPAFKHGALFLAGVLGTISARMSCLPIIPTAAPQVMTSQRSEPALRIVPLVPPKTVH